MGACVMVRTRVCEGYVRGTMTLCEGCVRVCEGYTKGILTSDNDVHNN